MDNNLELTSFHSLSNDISKNSGKLAKSNNTLNPSYGVQLNSKNGDRKN
jgi:hypothetical protein